MIIRKLKNGEFCTDKTIQLDFIKQKKLEIEYWKYHEKVVVESYIVCE